jgi:protein MpaA
MVRDIAAMLPRGGDTGCDDRRMRRRPEVARTAVAGSVVAGCVVACVWVPSVSVAGEVHEQRVVVGTSAGGRDLVAVHRWADGATRTTLVIGSMHGDEPAGTRVVRRLRSAPVPPGADLWLLPTVNPDGAAAGRRTNDQGVDLNRNFPRHWVEAGEGTATWSGPTPASEPETRAVQALLRQVRPRTVVVLHQPLFGVDSYRAKSMTLVHRLARALDLPVRSFDCGGGCHGTLTDWHNARLPGRAVTVELARTASDWRVRHTARGLLQLTTPDTTEGLR